MPLATTRFTAAQTNTIPVPTNPVVTKPPDTSTPMDIDSNHHRVENRTCYNCNKRGHISPHCPEPHKQRVCTNLAEEDIAGMISKSVTAGLDTHKPSHEKEEQIPAKEEGKGF